MALEQAVLEQLQRQELVAASGARVARVEALSFARAAALELPCVPASWIKSLGACQKNRRRQQQEPWRVLVAEAVVVIQTTKMPKMALDDLSL